MQGFIISLVIFTAIFAVFGLGLNLQWGYTGLINFGHVAFMAIGAYTTTLLSIRGTPLPIAVLIGATVAAGLGLLIGLSTLRLRTDYLAIVTIGVSEMLRLFAINEEWLTRGTFGLQGFPLPLEEFSPDYPMRIGMIIVLSLILGLSYWRMLEWLGARLKGVPIRVVITSTLAAIAYLGSLTILLGGVAVVAREIKLSQVVPPWMLGLGLLLVIATIGGVYLWFANRVLTRWMGWSKGLTLVSTVLVSIVGVWIYSIAIRAVYDYDSNPAKTSLMFISVVTTAVIFMVLQRLVRSPWGRVLKAIREDEEVATALGKNVFWYKLQALMLGGFIAGIAGALYTWQLTTVYPDNFQPLVTFNAWTIVVLGGAGNNAGVLLGSALFWAYQEITRFVLKDIVPLEDSRLAAFRIMVIGLLLMVLMMWRPQGILGKKEELTLGR